MNRLIDAIYFLLIASLFVNVPIYEGETGNTLNLYHALIALSCVATVRLGGRMRLSIDVMFLSAMCLTSVLGWAVYGMTTRALLLPMVLMAFTSGHHWFLRTTANQRRRTYHRVAWVVLASILVRNAVYHDHLGAIYTRSASDYDLFYLSSGGQNLEATHLGVLSVLLVGGPWFLPMLSIAWATSLLLLSRAGMLACLAAMGCWVVGGRLSGAKLVVSASLIAIAILAIGLEVTGVVEIAMLDRFDMSTEATLAADDEGRLAIWRSGWEVMTANGFGHGVGNGFGRLNDNIGSHLKENNSHNILVEYGLDGGWLCCGLFIGLLGSVLWRRDALSVPSHRFVLTYGLLGLCQFTGYDAIGWFFIGVSHAERHKIGISIRE